ncbi:nucleotide exchange factor GrpE [Aliidiomarina halalkaliphila]|uniref:Protein GrpE n=1 Tax=Aliidiomarina halalkaliphila TaxID=2593535 RepID=A0A552X2W9_9GAMM|nr:nucleotide exchange factor GrpE [Aliidiomarina halalkaliphila]TRW49378.1 nucleotide exchange factor GrpE [Aliidiomarina halalkaliphila]
MSKQRQTDESQVQSEQENQAATDEQVEQQTQETEQVAEGAEAAADEAQGDERVAELERKLSVLAHDLAQEKDKALRVAADAENAKRRAALEVEKARNFALEKFAGELLSVIDNLERALQTIDKEDEAQAKIAEGIEMTHKGFISTIEKFGMEVLDPQGQPFNPQLHEAMGMQEHAELPPNTVLYVMQKGYLLNGRLLRPAMVMVTKAASA